MLVLLDDAILGEGLQAPPEGKGQSIRSNGFFYSQVLLCSSSLMTPYLKRAYRHHNRDRVRVQGCLKLALLVTCGGPVNGVGLRALHGNAAKCRGLATQHVVGK